MPLTAKASGGDFPLPDEGTHLGVCYMVVDLGIQAIEYKGKPKLQHRCMIGWELPRQLMDDGRPFVVSKEYTVSLNEKSNLYKDLVNWRGKHFTEEELEGFDIFKVLGVPAQVVVLHKSGWARVDGVSKLMQGIEAPKDLYNPLLRFSFEDGGEPDQRIPEWIRNKIAEAKYRGWDEANAEREREEPPPAEPQDFDDDIPF